MKNLIPLLLLLFATLNIQAQKQVDLTTMKYVEIITKDGNMVAGQIKMLDSEKVVIESESLGQITIQKEDIAEVKNRSEVLNFDKKGFPEDIHNSTYYFATQSALTLEKGQRFYQNTYLFYNSFSYGITDRFQITAGFELATLLFGRQFPAVVISPKFSIPLDENVTLGLGVNLITVPFIDDPFFVGVLGANLTIGSRNKNLTVGSGLGFSTEGGVSEGVYPILVSGMTRLSRKLSFVSENGLVFVNGGDFTGVLSAGIRYHFNERGSAFNLALYRPTEDIEIIALPYASVNIAFGNK